MTPSRPTTYLPIMPPSASQARPAVHPQVAERLALAAQRIFIPKQQLAIALEASHGCIACPLSHTRNLDVPGEGDPKARLCFIGEAPGKEESDAGRPFVGAAGKLLDEMIAAMGLRRLNVFITNTVRCRPPMNRKPEQDELAACSDYLHATLGALPNLSHIVLLGATAAQSVLRDPLLKITRERGKWRDLVIPTKADPHRLVNIMPTFHPSYLLRSPWEKPKAWADLQEVVRVMKARHGSLRIEQEPT